MTLCIRRRACSVVVASSGSEEEEEEGEEEKGKGQRTVQRSFHCSVHNDCTDDFETIPEKNSLV